MDALEFHLSRDDDSIIINQKLSTAERPLNKQYRYAVRKYIVNEFFLRILYERLLNDTDSYLRKEAMLRVLLANEINNAANNSDKSQTVGNRDVFGPIAIYLRSNFSHNATLETLFFNDFIKSIESVKNPTLIDSVIERLPNSWITTDNLQCL